MGCDAMGQLSRGHTVQCSASAGILHLHPTSIHTTYTCIVYSHLLHLHPSSILHLNLQAPRVSSGSTSSCQEVGTHACILRTGEIYHCLTATQLIPQHYTCVLLLSTAYHPAPTLYIYSFTPTPPPPDPDRRSPNAFHLPPNAFRVPPTTYRLPPTSSHLPPNAAYHLPSTPTTDRLPLTAYHWPPPAFRFPPSLSTSGSSNVCAGKPSH